ncbi:MAG: bifunctional diaminohydroxyphosphoribosylaminopyrimidine deaminase/5-amino-6-(5-phosphoribosylamino)uracil reductase RibD [Gammaproteobacteria bacterium]|jgi:diaminohydroxyphosphoribosylaminopyrimidine deaminase/5-amino-6-(5-phosphoribosylamino)uracil reductase
MYASDHLFVKAALELASLGRNSCAPNPPVGCLIVRDGQVLGRGYHKEAGEAHAEVNAIADAGGDVAGATVYVSLEPCAFVGRTPACAQTLIDCAVARVVVGAGDPHPQVAGKGADMLRAAGIEVLMLELPEARAMIAGFASRITRKRPRVVLKSASSLDGAVALANGESQWITGPHARAQVQALRASCDAVITGAGTVIADNPQLNVRDPELLKGGVQQPLRVVLDPKLRVPADSQILSPGTLVVHAQGQGAGYTGIPAGQVEYLAVENDPVDLSALLEALAERGCNNVMVEAGPAVLGGFLTPGEVPLWDEWFCFIAPKVLGSASQTLAEFALVDLAQAHAAKIVERRMVGEDLCLRLVPQ